MPDHNSLIVIASSARRFLETIWPDWQIEKQQLFGSPAPVVMSYSTCARSSTFIQKILDDLGMPAEMRHGWFRSEMSDLPPGSDDRHTWVASGPWFIDVTADQFGAEKIIVTNECDDRYRSDVDVALPEFRLRRIQAVSEIWERWLGSPIRERLFADLD